MMEIDLKDRVPLTAEELARFKPDIRRFHHVAYKCRDAEEARHFYEDIMGLEFVAAFTDVLPRSRLDPRPVPYMHVFFATSSGECIAFFDIADGRAPAFDPDTPAFVQHIAMEMPDETSLLAMKDRLEAAGVKVDYYKDHEFCRSIYFCDPNGHRLELSWNTKQADAFWVREKAAARSALKVWSAQKPRAGGTAIA